MMTQKRHHAIKRRKLVLQMWNRGLTLREIGYQFGFSSRRARQLVMQAKRWEAEGKLQCDPRAGGE